MVRPIDAIADVAVVGGGIAGLLVARGLSRAGYSVLLLEARALGGEQSTHNHGYLHLGYAYLDAESSMVHKLRQAARGWGTLPVEYLPTASWIALPRSLATSACENWRRIQLGELREGSPPWSSLGHVYFRSPERTIQPASTLKALIEEVVGLGAMIQEASCERLALTESNEVRITASCEGEARHFQARAAVVAAGAGSTRLLERSGLVNDTELRLSFMAVFKGSQPPFAGVFPGDEARGIFIASREIDGACVWLISDRQSFSPGGVESEGIAAWWLSNVANTLADLIPAEVLDRVEQVGIYAAMKSGLRPTRGTVAEDSCFSTGSGSITVIAPAKLTVAPLAAEEACRQIMEHLGRPRLIAPGSSSIRDPSMRTRAVIRERWEETKLHSISGPEWFRHATPKVTMNLLRGG
jgi:glycine/D-amino acid oxidase-like deaminating enzyme